MYSWKGILSSKILDILETTPASLNHILLASDILTYFMDDSFPLPEIKTTPNGGLVFIWNKNNITVQVETLDRYSFRYYIKDDEFEAECLMSFGLLAKFLGIIKG